MQQKHLFIMDPVEKLNLARDSSLRIAYALSHRNQALYFCETQDLFWKSGQEPHCRARSIQFSNSAEHFELGREEECALDGFASIHMRKDPPVDIAYISATWFLDPCKKALVVNKPEALRGFNEKLGMLRYPNDCKTSLVSSDPEQLFYFLRDFCQGNGVLKPLHLYGGKGIEHVTLAQKSQDACLAFFKEQTEGGKVAKLLQAFDSRVYDGEIRAFTVGGKALAWCKKRPQEGKFLANTASGASLHEFTPSRSLLQRVERVAEDLVKLGLYFIGFDIIGEEITEINVTSPRLLPAPGDSHDYYADIAEWLVQACAKQNP